MFEFENILENELLVILGIEGLLVGKTHQRPSVVSLSNTLNFLLP